MVRDRTATPFHALPTRIDLPAAEAAIIDWWREQDIFARSLARTANGPRWGFYEGPPTANGSPGVHHVEARVFKDVFPRFKSMKGYSVSRQAGWDCHGLPVELAVEKELGLDGKPQIETFGITEFNARCRDSVMRHVGEFEELTQRMGYWIDLDHPYTTMSPEYIDSVWWSLQQIFARGLLTEDFRVAPYCPRCGTTLSDHELAQGYEIVTDPSVYVRMPLLDSVAGVDDADLLIWTTTPWTLPANTAVAVNPSTVYAIARTGSGTFLVAEPLVGAVLGEDAETVATVAGTELAGLRYLPPFDLVEIPDAHRIIEADYVTTDEGTGLVHQAPAFGADDLFVCQANGLPLINPVQSNGRFSDHLDLIGDVFFKHADPILIRDLDDRGLLFAQSNFEHSYPHCWRCHTPLMYYAQPSWYIRTTAVREQLHRENERTNWFPDTIKYGRFGNWLDNNIDWAVSRSRYWGTPLPLWRCPSDHVTAIGSRAQLGQLSGMEVSDIDPHRPFIDAVTFDCPECDATATRVPEVIDAWYDSGAMPFASLGYPHLPGSVEAFERDHPAQYICEAIDQTRGWFYTMMAIGTLVFDRSPYENVVCLGHILAEDGRKMSKHLGNVLAPIPLMNAHSADSLRWFMACSGSPWSARRVGPGPLDEISRRLLMTYWSTASFFALYASNSEWAPHTANPPAERSVLDRWILSQLHSLAATVDERLEEYDTAGAGRLLTEFVDALSNWYVRRSRARFWNGEQDALSTLFECLDILTRLLAPFVPFITEQVWQDVIRLSGDDVPESVHLADWPRADTNLIDTDLAGQVAVAQSLAEAGRAARKSSKVRVRQPLARALVGLPPGVDLPQSLLDEVADELNVKKLAPLQKVSAVVDVSVKANFRTLGKRFGKQTQAVANAVLTTDAPHLAAQLRENGTAIIEFDGNDIVLTPDDVIVSELPRTGWVVESQKGVTIALDTEITAELAAEGVARDVVRVIQNARREADLDVSDRIELTIAAPESISATIKAHEAHISHETLAKSIAVKNSLGDGYTGTVGDGHEIRVSVAKVE